MTPPLPMTTDVLLIGGGHTHALVLKAWGMNPLAGVRLTLINPGPTAPYSGMLPGHVAGHYARDELDIDLVQLARFARARIVLGKVCGLDPVARVAQIEGGREIAYDVASIDVGIHSEMPDLPGFCAHGIAAKPLDVFAEKWDRFIADGGGPVGVIGGGVAGAELAMAAAFRLKPTGRASDVTLVDRGDILDALPPRAQNKLLRELVAHGITLHSGADVSEVTATTLELADGRAIPSTFTLGAAGARPHRWLTGIGLQTDAGYLSVGPTLQTSDAAVFAAGDCAHLGFAPRPKAGVFAVREAPILHHNLRALAMGRKDDLRPFQPQRDYLKLISLGGKRALAEKAGMAISGPLLWRWKNRIDQQFMQRFRGLSPMPAAALPHDVAEGVSAAIGDKPLCGGCGAKLGARSLSAALTALPAVARTDILSHPGDDAAILKCGDQFQVITTDHLRAFTDDPACMARIAAVHALGDCWAMGASPQSALATVILPRATPDLHSRWLREIMAEAAHVFAAEGAAIVGGHSSQGDELTIGFTVTGLMKTAPVTLQGARPGDKIILTKPIGTGVIMAAEMQLQAPGAIVAHAWGVMCEPSGAAAKILGPKARAMTDVTGFGLAGHLMNICDASGVAARLHLDQIPLLPGAADLNAKGIRSTIYGQNAEAVKSRITPISNPIAALLFDPQTAGGLLAAIPADDAAKIIDDLAATETPATIIGEITKGAPSIELL